MKVDHLIIGQGLAGSLLAWHLISRGRKVLVVDRDEAVTSSKVAAGLVTPISGQQFSLPIGLDETLNFARQTYWDIEEEVGSQFFHHLRIARLFGSESDQAKWAKRLTDPERAERYKDYYSELKVDNELVKAEHGGIEIKNGGWLNVADFVEAIRIYLLERLAYAIGKVSSFDIEALPSGGVKWRNITAENVTFCEGWQGCNNHYFGKIQMNNARGDILKIRCEKLAAEPKIINRHGWVLPLGNGEFRGGSTYDHNYLDDRPTEKGKIEVETKISSLITPDYQVLDHQSAIRPIIKRSRIFMGRHPELNDIVYFNGLGSKGVLNAPEATLALAQHLVSSKPIDAEQDIREQFDWS